jgi:hypothetical protein
MGRLGSGGVCLQQLGRVGVACGGGAQSDTVEVGRLHTLRLESLKPIFQPRHKCLVIKL